MQIVPVIDLIEGQVVRGVGGRRSEYRPIESRLASDARPASIGQAFASLGFRTAYVADLDAIAGRPPAWSIYRELLACGLELWIDAGIAGAEQAQAIAGFSPSITGVVAGLESLPRLEALGELLAEIGARRMVFSLDLKEGRPLTSIPEWAGASPRAIAGAVLDQGIERMIVLDLAQVGQGAGVGTEELCRWLRERSPGLELIAGGGVRGSADLESLESAGCDGALVASALHDGRLAPASFLRSG
jgi:phosphoribosylformimino-5-aminoimidazole carboxamide ribotide isomerase